MTHLSSNVNESGVLWFEVLTESSEVKEMRVEFASVVVLDRKNEVNSNRICIIGGFTNIRNVLWLKTKIGHLLP